MKSTVALDREVYEEKVRDFLSCHAYKKPKKDYTSDVQRNLNKILAEIFEKYPESKNSYFRLICRNGSAPEFYGLQRSTSLTALYDLL